MGGKEFAVEVTVISSVSRRQALLHGELRSRFSEHGIRMSVFRCRGKRAFLATTGRYPFAMIFLSVCVGNSGKVSATGRLHESSASYLLVFAAASASRTLRKFRIQTLRCLMGPCDRGSVSTLASRVLSHVPSSKGCVSMGMGNDGVRVPFQGVVCTRRFSRVVRVRATNRERLVAHRSFSSFVASLGVSPHFCRYGQNIIVGLRRTISFSKSNFHLSGKDGIPIDQGLLGGTERAFVRFLFREES